LHTLIYHKSTVFILIKVFNATKFHIGLIIIFFYFYFQACEALFHKRKKKPPLAFGTNQEGKSDKGQTAKGKGQTAIGHFWKTKSQSQSTSSQCTKGQIQNIEGQSQNVKGQIHNAEGQSQNDKGQSQNDKGQADGCKSHMHNNSFSSARYVNVRTEKKLVDDEVDTSADSMELTFELEDPDSDIFTQSTDKASDCESEDLLPGMRSKRKQNVDAELGQVRKVLKLNGTGELRISDEDENNLDDIDNEETQATESDNEVLVASASDGEPNSEDASDEVEEASNDTGSDSFDRMLKTYVINEKVKEKVQGEKVKEKVKGDVLSGKKIATRAQTKNDVLPKEPAASHKCNGSTNKEQTTSHMCNDSINVNEYNSKAELEKSTKDCIATCKVSSCFVLIYCTVIVKDFIGPLFTTVVA